MTSALYLDTSVVLRTCLESGSNPELEVRVRRARVLLTSRLSLVEASRAFHRLRQQSRVPEAELADAERETNALWARCQLWELTAAVCETARNVAPGMALRSLDALHLATFVLARQKIKGIELLTVDDRLRSAALAI